MKLLENRVPPPLVALLFAVAMWAASPGMPALAVVAHTRLLGVGVAVSAGIFCCVAGVLEFRRARTTVNPLKPETASALVSSGIYRWTRNPMYLGFSMILLAWAIYLGWPWALLGVAGYVCYIDRLQIVPEERAMARLFGAGFADYAARVRRWL